MTDASNDVTDASDGVTAASDLDMADGGVKDEVNGVNSGKASINY